LQSKADERSMAPNRAWWQFPLGMKCRRVTSFSIHHLSLLKIPSQRKSGFGAGTRSYKPRPTKSVRKALAAVLLSRSSTVVHAQSPERALRPEPLRDQEQVAIGFVRRRGVRSDGATHRLAGAR